MNDYINGLFEIGGGILCWMNVLKLRKDRKVCGVYWPVQAFFAAWGWWNLYYYPSLGQWASFAGGVVLVAGNSLWVVLAVRYMRQNATHDGRRIRRTVDGIVGFQEGKT